MNIIQYLPEYAVRQVINHSSTFCLRSLRYYRELESASLNNGIADSSEQSVDFSDDYSHEWLIAGVLISSWCIAKNQANPEPDWELIPGRKNGIAILSTVEAVAQFIKDNTETLLHKDWELRHNKVHYYGNSKPPNYKTDDIMFFKRAEFSNQEEYRFALVGYANQAHLQTVIFYNKDYKKAPDYINKIFLGPESSKELEYLIDYRTKALDVFNKVEGWKYWNNRT